MEDSEIILLAVAIMVVLVVIALQIKSFLDTRAKISKLTCFFPDISKLSIIHSSIKKSDIETPSALKYFLKNPRKRMDNTPLSSDAYEECSSIPQDEYVDVDLIKDVEREGFLFNEVIDETNAYLCKNVGTSADFTILESICNSKVMAVETEIQNTINVPLYLGLGGTFIGIIVGLVGVVSNIDVIFGKGSAEVTSSPIQALLVGVVIAMFASFVGLGLMTWNSAVEHKNALRICDKDKISYFDFLRRELMPSLSNSMASSLNSLKSVLGEFIGKFGGNLSAYNASAEILNDNIKKQHLLLVEVNKMNQLQIATTIADAFKQLNQSAQAISTFHRYQEDLNSTIEKVDIALSRIDNIICSFDDFAKALAIVVENQGVTTALQTAFKASIEQHFPIGAEAREIWRKEFDILTADAKAVTEELNSQLKASTEYIRLFTETNKDSFLALGNLEEVLDSLVKYANVQATCYKDLKDEIQAMKEYQSKAEANQSRLNADLLIAVKEMMAAVKAIKNV